MYCHLLDLGFPAVAVNVGERPRDNEKFANLKAELYWGLRLRAEAGDMSGLLDDKTIGQLAGIRYKHNARGQIQIESKEDARKRGVKSPDRAESVMLAFAELGTGGTIYARTLSNDDFVFDLAEMSPGFGNYGSYQQRVIAVGYGSAKPMAFLEIIDDGKVIWVLREYFLDGARATLPKTDAAYAEDLEYFMRGDNPLSPDAPPVLRSNPKDAVVVIAPGAENFQQECIVRGLWCVDGDIDLLEGIQLVGSLFERKLVRVNSRCRHFIQEHKNYGWDRQKAAQGIEEPISVNAQTVEAFRLYVKTFWHSWRLQ